MNYFRSYDLNFVATDDVYSDIERSMTRIDFAQILSKVVLLDTDQRRYWRHCPIEACNEKRMDSFLIPLSLEFPDIVFDLEVEDDDKWDVWKKQYKNGKTRRVVVERKMPDIREASWS